MSEKTVLKELRKALEFYKELGFEYLPVKLLDAYRNAELRTQNSDNPPIPPLSKGGEGGFISEPGTQYPEPDKESALIALREEIGNCQRCKLSRGRINIVFGEGNPDAKLMFIGEGPGQEEDLQARPFVGDAGKLLTRLIEKMGFKRKEVYIANIVKCRPPMNREPEKDEINTCRPFVERQIKIINPKAIMSLGKISAQSLLNSKTMISRLRGTFFDYLNIPLMPTFHPAYLLRNPKDKKLTWDDAQKVLERLK